MSKRIPLQPASLHQPVAKALHRDEMMIAGRDAERLRLRGLRVQLLRGLRFIATLLEPVGHLVRVEVSEQLESTTEERGLAAGHGQRDVLAAVALRFEMLSEGGDMIGERFLARLLKRIKQPGVRLLRLPLQFGQPLPGSGLVFEQRDFANDAVWRTEPTVPTWKTSHRLAWRREHSSDSVCHRGRRSA